MVLIRARRPGAHRTDRPDATRDLVLGRGRVSGPAVRLAPEGIDRRTRGTHGAWRRVAAWPDVRGMRVDSGARGAVLTIEAGERAGRLSVRLGGTGVGAEAIDVAVRNFTHGRVALGR